MLELSMTESSRDRLATYRRLNLHEIAPDSIINAPSLSLARLQHQGFIGSGTSDELALLRSAGD